VKKIAEWINEAIEVSRKYASLNMTQKERKKYKEVVRSDKDLRRIAKAVKRMCNKFPIPSA